LASASQKKIFIADQLAPFVAKGYDAVGELGFLDAWMLSLSYTFQLYFDFSGYSDMAIAMSLLFGVMLRSQNISRVINWAANRLAALQSARGVKVNGSNFRFNIITVGASNSRPCKKALPIHRRVFCRHGGGGPRAVSRCRPACRSGLFAVLS
jgi:hypothetical protein